MLELKKAVGLSAKGEIALKELNRLVGEGSDYKVVLKQKARLVDEIVIVNKEVRDSAYETILKTKAPMEELVSKMSYPKVTLKENLDKAKIVESYEIGFSEVLFSLEVISKLNRTLISPCMFRRVDLMGEKLYNKVVADMELKIGGKAEYNISTKPDEKELLANLPPEKYSLSTLRKELQKDVDDILFIPSEKDPTLNSLKVQSSDVKYLIATLFKHGGKIQTISMPRYATVLARILEVTNKLYMKNSYVAV